jgi:hypothetical protein
MISRWSILLILIALSCDSLERVNTDVCPSCFNAVVNQSRGPVEIWRYQFDKQTVYLTVPDCCDQYAKLYSENCQYLCAPSGGIAGGGDGKCPDFHDKATNGVLVWKKK